MANETATPETSSSTNSAAIPIFKSSYSPTLSLSSSSSSGWQHHQHFFILAPFSNKISAKLDNFAL